MLMWNRGDGMNGRYFLAGAVVIALVCALAVSGAFLLSAWNSGSSPAETCEPAQTETTVSAETEAEPEPDWRLLLVNPWNPLPEDFRVEVTDIGDDQAVDSRVWPFLAQLLEEAKRDGMELVVCSSFRTRQVQQTLFDNKIRRLRDQGMTPEEAEGEAAKWVARPGTSEHEAGLAVDMVAADFRNLTAAQAERPEQQWLMQNAHRFGFILRYPKEKTELTGIGYEPWHYRYVGPEAAARIYAAGVCLEEYLESQNVK